MERTLVLVSGLPATGKTTVAEGFARRLHTVSFSRDWSREEVVRKLRSRADRELDPLYARLNRGHRPRAQRLANTLLLEVVRRHVQYDHPVVVEVVADPRLRSALSRVAQDSDAKYFELECVCSNRAIWESRLRDRGGNWTAAIPRIERWYTPPGPEVARLDSGIDLPEAMIEVATRLARE